MGQPADRAFHACDTEVADIDLSKQGPVGNGHVTCVSVFSGPDVDFGSGPRLWVETLDPSLGALEALRPFLESEEQRKVWHNYSFDRHVLYNHGVDAQGLGGDTMHMARLWDSELGAYSLQALTERLLPPALRKAPMKERFSLPKKKKDGSDAKTTYMPPVEELQTAERSREAFIEYSVLDAEATWHLREWLEAALRRQAWQHLTMYEFYETYLVPFAVCLTDLERRGFKMNRARLEEIQTIAEQERAEAEQRFLAWAQSRCPEAAHMNIASDPQKQTLLFAPFKNARTGKWLEVTRTFQRPNVEGFVEEGKTKPKKNRDLVLRGMGLPAPELTNSGWPAVTQGALKKLVESLDESAEEERAAVQALCDVGAIDTMLGTFIGPLQSLLDQNDRIHCSLNLNTATGRLSARMPNLQNQPALDKDRYKLRAAFTCEPGNALIVADYGQLELRLLAQMANCRSMLDAFKAGGDFHSRTAMGMYPYIKEAVDRGEVLLEWDEEDSEPPLPLLKDRFGSERRKAKVLNFSIAYGKTARGLAADFGVTVEEAQETVEAWYRDRPEVRAWQENAREWAREHRHIQTLMGRYRSLNDAGALDDLARRRAAGEPIESGESRRARVAEGRAGRAAINTPIQGGAADVTMMAMLKLHAHERLRELGWHMLLQVHDEIILEGPEESAEEAQQIVVETMERPMEHQLRVGLVVDATSAKTWYDAK